MKCCDASGSWDFDKPHQTAAVNEFRLPDPTAVAYTIPLMTTSLPTRPTHNPPTKLKHRHLRCRRVLLNIIVTIAAVALQLYDWNGFILMHRSHAALYSLL